MPIKKILGVKKTCTLIVQKFPWMDKVMCRNRIHYAKKGNRNQIPKNTKAILYIRGMIIKKEKRNQSIIIKRR